MFFTKSWDWLKLEPPLPMLQVPAGTLFAGGDFVLQLMCQPETGFTAQHRAVTAKVQELHPCLFLRVSRALITQIPSELISAMLLDYFLRQKIFAEATSDRLPPATSRAGFSDWPIWAPRSCWSWQSQWHSYIIMRICFLLGWEIPVTYSFGHGFWLLSAQLPQRCPEPASSGVTDSRTQPFRVTKC